MHNEFVSVEGEKMSKSLGNIFTLNDISQKGFSPLAHRYWLLTAHYGTLVNFTWDALAGAQTALNKLYDHILEYGDDEGRVNEKYKERFLEYINDDLDTPRAVALIWELVKDGSVPDVDKKATMLNFDKVLGLGFADIKPEVIPENILRLSEEREEARRAENWRRSDALRDEINEKGFEILDTDGGTRIKKITK